MKKSLYAVAALVCAVLVVLVMWTPTGSVQASQGSDTAAAHRPPQAGGHAFSQLNLDPGSLAGTCSITCSNGDTGTTTAENAGDCACDCARLCEQTCTATGGGQTASCGYN